jgi:hypothetical protein
MTLANSLKLDVVTFASVAVPLTPTATFSSIRSSEVQGGAQYFAEHPAGHPAPMFGAVSRVEPIVNFSTPQIDTVLGALSTWGAAVSAKLYHKKTTGVAPASRAGTVHARYDVASAIACWNQITLPALGVGEASVMLRAIWDGSSLPIVRNAGVAALAGAMVATNHFAAGKVLINTVELDGVESITIASGCQGRGEFDASTVYPTFAENNVGMTLVTIRTKNQINWGTILITGLAVTDLTFYAKKWANAQSTSFVANATAEHIKFATTVALATVVGSGGSGQELVSDTCQFLILAASDTVAPLTTTLLSAIT